MKKYNWIIDPIEVNASPYEWGIANNIKFEIISLAEQPEDTYMGYKNTRYKPVRATKMVKYYATMTEADVAAFKLYTNELSIKKAKW
jgi:hypothetical protein